MSVKTYTGNEGTREQPNNQLWLGLIIRNTLTPNTVTVSTSAVPIPATPLSKRRILSIMNISTNVVYVGDSAVTTSNGFPLYPRAVIQINIEDDVVVYGISTGSSELRILEGA